MNETNVIELISNYKYYRRVVDAMNIAKDYYISDFETFPELISEYQKQIKIIENLVKSFAPSRTFILIDLHYLKEIPLDKCFECMGVSRATGYRYLKRAIEGLNNRYERIKKQNGTDHSKHKSN